MTHAAVAELNGLVSSTVTKWCGRERETGTPAAKPMGGHRPWKLADEREWLLARITEKPDLTLHALLDELAERDAVVSCVRQTCRAPASGRSTAARPRVAWLRHDEVEAAEVAHDREVREFQRHVDAAMVLACDLALAQHGQRLARR